MQYTYNCLDPVRKIIRSTSIAPLPSRSSPNYFIFSYLNTTQLPKIRNKMSTAALQPMPCLRIFYNSCALTLPQIFDETIGPLRRQPGSPCFALFQQNSCSLSKAILFLLYSLLVIIPFCASIIQRQSIGDYLMQTTHILSQLLDVLFSH